MDLTADLIAQVKTACAEGKRLGVMGQGSKWARVGMPASDLFSVADHTGIIEHLPAELVVTARAGTPLTELNAELGQSRQRLAADPPLYLGAGTVGGAVSAGLSGPARPWHGALRDAVLGVKLLTAGGEVMQFGGQVMKNVAGYDVSRLLAGACGALGVLLEVSLRLQPVPDHTLTLRYELDAEQALDHCRALARLPLPVAGTYWHQDRLWVRFEGSEAGLLASRAKLGGEEDTDPGLWRAVRDQQTEFFSAAARTDDTLSLIRVSVPPASPVSAYPDQVVEWGGGVRWIWHDNFDQVADAAYEAGGWAWQTGAPPPLSHPVRNLMWRIKQSFDPQHLFASPLEHGLED